MADDKSKRGKKSKAKQRNVSVYVGRRGDWMERVLTLVCRQQGWSESKLFRELFLERLAKWGLYDPEIGEPIMAKIEKLEGATPVTKALPDVIDLTEFRSRSDHAE